MSGLINREQVADWTKCRQRSKQIRWFNDNGIAYRLDADGWPITTEQAVNASLMDENQDKVSF